MRSDLIDDLLKMPFTAKLIDPRLRQAAALCGLPSIPEDRP